MNRRGSILIEVVFALAIFFMVATTVFAAVSNGASAIQRAISLEEGRDLAATALSLVAVGELTPESLDGMSELELHAILNGVEEEQDDQEPFYLITAQLQPTGDLALTRIDISVSDAQTGATVGSRFGLIDLNAARGAQ